MDLRLGRNDQETTYWTVLADVMTSMFFLVILYVLIQHLRTFSESAINEQLAKDQREVYSALKSEIDPRFRDRIVIDSLAPDRQKLTFSSDVLFSPCKSNLTAEGRSLLVAVGRILKNRQPYLEAIQVEGHTDRRPTGSYGCNYLTNWELSSERATTVVRLMADSSQIVGPKLSAIGRGQFHPVSDATGDDSASYARNRRIEITLQYDRQRVTHLLGGAPPLSAQTSLLKVGS